ncbi:putative capsular polysaccharide synthesis family protein [uncultured Rubinisphaera sp.]|uniref:putative capsular polysaccharide synthesis family protein n=1 Tax=uncultured Rubinisphaera sp. TaxID=1678686 RepID=UPI0030DD201C|tara:strand:- start:2729 stop:3511 length:783 start_codon:yes stop_codon:yes gene_type:complete
MLAKILNLIEVLKWFRDADADSFLIYQPGKVGSTAVENALKKAGKKTFHAHQLHSSQIDILPISALSKLKNLSRVIYVFFTNRAFRRSLTSVIVIVRDPIDHIRSLTFHHLDKVLYLYFQRHKDTRKHQSFTQLLRPIYREIIDVDYASHWLEQEFLPLTKINLKDLEGRSFPFEITTGKKRYLFLRYEDLKTSEHTLAEFCNVDGFALEEANHSSQKWYASLYEEAKSDQELTEELQKHLKQGLFAKTFYGESNDISSV